MKIRTLDDLESALERFPDDPDGNRPAATYLWGYQYGNQLGWLRGLVAWVRRHGLVDQDALRAWRMEATTNGTSPARSGTWDPLRTAGW